MCVGGLVELARWVIDMRPVIGLVGDVVLVDRSLPQGVRYLSLGHHSGSFPSHRLAVASSLLETLLTFARDSPNYLVSKAVF